MKSTICILFFLTISGKLLSQNLKDTIFFRNGSIIIGEIKMIKLGVVTFDPDDANDITVQLIKLKTISAPGVIFRVENTAEHVYYGKLVPSSKPGICQHCLRQGYRGGGTGENFSSLSI